MPEELLGLSPAIARTAAKVGHDAMAHGGLAVMLTGSHARREAHSSSDIDLYVIGDGPGYQLMQHGPYLVSVSWVLESDVKRAFQSPDKVGAAVPGWRRALLVEDPHGIGAALRVTAQQWNWDDIGDGVLREWVAQEVIGFAEELHKLCNCLEANDLWGASVQRSILALHLAIPLSVHYRLLYESENQLWRAVADAAGSLWAEAQAAAWGLTSPLHLATLHGALRLFTLATEIIWPTLNPQQQQVARFALARATRQMKPAHLP